MNDTWIITKTKQTQYLEQCKDAIQKNLLCQMSLDINYQGWMLPDIYEKE